jgi:hypothetical protein
VSSHPQHGDEQVSEAVGACALDAAGARAQLARYARLASSVALLRREPASLLVSFEQGFDRPTLERALAIERECCPFLSFELSGRELRVTVSEQSLRPALGVLARAFAGGHEAGAGT